ncbi:MAG: GAF domain-containing protein [Cyanobacteria bacterium P01_C01_bin.121]
MVEIANTNGVDSPQKGHDTSTAVSTAVDSCPGSDAHQGKDAHANVTELRQTNLLKGVAEAARRLLAILDFDTAVNKALEAIALAASIDRIYILENLIEPTAGENFALLPYEWTAPGVIRRSDLPNRFAKAYLNFGDWLDRWKRAREPIQALARDLSKPAQVLQEKDEALSLLTVPIFVDEQFWGVIGFDDCTTERIWSDGETAALETAAACIGSAIERERTQKKRQLAEKTVFLEREKAAQARGAELAKVNRVLQETIDTLVTEPELSRFLGYVLQAIALQFESPFLEYWRSGKDNIAYLELAVVNGEVLSGEQLAGHHGVEGLAVPADAIDADDLFQRTQHTVYNISPADPFIATFYDNIKAWTQDHGIDLSGKAFNFPVVLGEHSFGAIAISIPSGRILPEETIELGYALSNQAALAVQLTQLAEETQQIALLEERDRASQQRAIELSQVNNVLQTSLNQLVNTPNLDAFLGHVIHTINQAVGACSGHVFLYDTAANTLRLQLSVEQGSVHLGAKTEEPELFHQPFPADVTPAYSQLCETGEIGLFSIIDADPMLMWPGNAEWHRRVGHQEAAAVALSAGDRPVGMLGLSFAERASLNQEDFDLIRALADQASLAIQLATLAEEATQSAVLEEREKSARNRVAELSKSNEAIAKSLSTLAAKPQLSAFLGQLLTAIAQQVGADLSHLFLYDESTHTFNLHTGVRDGHIYSGAAPEDLELFHHPIPADLTRVWEVIKSKQLIVFDENSSFDESIWWPGTPEWHLSQGHVSMTCIPMKAGAQVLGFIGFAFCDRTLLTDEQVEFMQALTNQAIVAIQLTRLAEEAKQAAILQEQEKAARDRVTELAKTNEAISQTLTTLATTPELDQFLGTILGEMVRPLDACKAHLFLYDEPTHTLTQRVVVQDGQLYMSAGPTDPDLFRRPIPADITPGWDVIINSGRPLTYDETLPFDEDIWWSESLDWHKEQGHKAITCIPLKAGEQPIGYIGFCFYDRTVLTDEQLEFMQALANQAIVAIQLTRLAEDAKQTAILQEQEKAAQKRAAQLTRSNQALKSSLDSLAQQPELDSFLQRVVNESALQSGAANGHLFLHDENAENFFLHVATDNNGDWRALSDMALWEQPTPIDAAPAFWDLLCKKKPLIVENLQETLHPGPHIWEPSIAWHRNRQHTSFICVPLVLGDRILGFLGLPFVGESSITQDDVELAQALANQATLAIQLTGLAEDAKQTAILQEQEKAASQRAAELAKTNEALSQTLNVLTTESELDSLLSKILIQINQKLGVDDSHLFLYDVDTHTLRQHIAVQSGQIFFGNAPGDPDIFKAPIPADITRGWELISSAAKPFTIDENNPDAAEFRWPTTPEWHASRGHQSATCACMKVGDQPIGFIGFAFCDRTVLTDEQLEFIQALTNQATLSIQLTRLADQAQSAALSAVLNDERNRLAREIHDTLAQAFTGISLQLEAAKVAAAEDSEGALYHINRAGNLARQGLSEARRSVRALRSRALETDTLTNALRTAIEEMTQSSDTQTRFVLQGTPYPLPEDIQTNLLRIGQEAITNALRHAQADTLTLTLDFCDHHIRMTITDDGQGCHITSLADVEGFGLLGMRERVDRFDGQFSFNSTLGSGTVIVVAIPIDL